MKDIVSKFNSKFVEILNFIQGVQLRVDGQVEPRFKEMRKQLSIALTANPEFTLTHFGPILESCGDDIIDGNIEKLLSLSYTMYADDEEDKQIIVEYTKKAHTLYNKATNAEVDTIIDLARELLDLYFDYNLSHQ